MFEAVVLQSHEVRLEPAAGAVRPSIQFFPNPTRIHLKLADEFLQLTETTEFQPHEGSSETSIAGQAVVVTVVSTSRGFV